MSKTEAVICYLLSKSHPRAIRKTNLMKLCYLSDLESVRRTGEQITEQEYERDSYGAVAYAIPNAARLLGGVDVKDYVTHSGKHGTDFCAAPGMPDPEYVLTVQEKVVIDDVFDRYEDWLATTLGDETKKTEPWVKALESGDKRLDLSVVSPADQKAYNRQVLSRIDRSTRGTPEEIAERDAEVDEWMRPLRSAALGGR